MNHDVLNQPPPLENYDAYSSDGWLTAAVRRNNASWISGAATSLGRFVGSAPAQRHADLANKNPPTLQTHDRYGNRIDAVDFHPSYHELMERAIGAGVHSIAWKRDRGGFSGHAVLFYLWNQLEQGTACPVTMTFAAIPVLTHAPDIAAEWRPKILSDAYDPRLVPVREKAGATIGMAMTEKQGGSDLRAVRTEAKKDG